MRCEDVRHKILEQTLEGSAVLGDSLGQHLYGCPACQDFYARVGEVDLALRALPADSVPAWRTQRIVVRATTSTLPESSFLPWTIWVPVASLLGGILWAYLALVWPSGPDLIRSVDPTVVGWLAQFEQWISTQQPMLSTVALAVGAGILFTLLAIGLGLYVGRDRITVRPRHSQ